MEEADGIEIQGQYYLLVLDAAVRWRVARSSSLRRDLSASPSPFPLSLFDVNGPRRLLLLVELSLSFLGPGGRAGGLLLGAFGVSLCAVAFADRLVLILAGLLGAGVRGVGALDGRSLTGLGGLGALVGPVGGRHGVSSCSLGSFSGVDRHRPQSIG